MLELTEKTLFEIRSKLSNDAIIRKLLLIDSNDALEQPAPATDAAQDYITVRSFQNFESQEPYNQNSCINIFPTSIKLSNDNTINSVIAINIIINSNNWEIAHNHNRVLLLSDQVIKNLHNIKFSTALKCIFVSMQDLIINKQLIGYQLLFNIKDGSNQIDF